MMIVLLVLLLLLLLLVLRVMAGALHPFDAAETILALAASWVTV
jgi:hypothetical protein